MENLKIIEDEKMWLITIIADKKDGDQGISIQKTPSKTVETVEDFEKRFLKTLTEEEKMDIEFINMEFANKAVYDDKYKELELRIDKDRKKRRYDLMQRLTEKVYI